jgi:RHS repeat-associated protein
MNIRQQVTALILIAAGGVLQPATAASTAAVPEFMTGAEVRAWQAERTKAAAPERSERPNSSSVPHFTGKPLDSDSGTYLFRFRAYDPELSRWKSFDPSGFPDGANNCKFLGAPTSCVDFQGLFALSTTSPSTATVTDSVTGSVTAVAWSLHHVSAGSSAAGTLAGLITLVQDTELKS